MYPRGHRTARAIDRIEHEGSELVLTHGVADGVDNVDRTEHSGFHRRWPQVQHDGVDLPANERRVQRDPVVDAERVLRRYRCYRRRAEHPKAMIGLEVGLNAGAASGIGAGDRECNAHDEKCAARSCCAASGKLSSSLSAGLRRRRRQAQNALIERLVALSVLGES